MPPLTLAGVALLGLIIMGGGLLLILVMLIRRLASGRGSAARHRESGAETAMISAALQEAVARLKAQERATAARAEASERLASQIVEGLTSGLVVVDRVGHIQTMNPAARRILDIGESAAGRPYREALSEAPALGDVIGEALRTSSAIGRRTVALEGRLKPSHLGVSVSPITNATGALQAVVCLFTDLTAVVELEEQLRLKEALARLGELTAGLAHEFRNGLATIHGYGRLLDPDVLPASQRPYVEGIRHETIALGEVVTNFLRFARPEPLARQPVDLRAVIVRAIEDVPGGSAHVSLEGTFGIVDGDDVLLRQAFANLLRNSVDACSAAGLVPSVIVAAAIEGDEVHVIVDDNGPGLAAAALEHAFQPFATTKAHGTGLGLAIVQKVIVSHNGRVAVANRPEGGAQFRIRLPLSSTS